MKTLVNKRNPLVMITASGLEIDSPEDYYRIPGVALLWNKEWELVEEKEVDLKKEIAKYFYNYKNPKTGEKLSKSSCYLNHRQAIKLAKYFYELGKKGGNK